MLTPYSGHDLRLALDLLDRLLPVYGTILARLKAQGVEWVQIDEPILALDLSADWRTAFERAYHHLNAAGVKLMLASYFGPLRENLLMAMKLPVAGVHVDCVRGGDELAQVIDWLPIYNFTLGIVSVFVTAFLLWKRSPYALPAYAVPECTGSKLTQYAYPVSGSSTTGLHDWP